MPAADTRAAAGTASWLTIPASTLMHSLVCPRASDRKSVGIFFRGIYLRGEPPPSGWRKHQSRMRVLRGENHPNNIAQKAHTQGVLLRRAEGQSVSKLLDQAEPQGNSLRVSGSI
jgi:hypothetical protein